MDTNDLNRRVRYALSLDDADVVDLLRLSSFAANVEQVQAWRLKEGEVGYTPCPPQALYAVLDGLIVQRRGARDESEPADASAKHTTPSQEGQAFVDNNEVLKQLRIALSLKTDDVNDLIIIGGGKITKSETRALFRKKDARNYRRCGDQVLRWFLAGLAARRDAPSD